MIALLRSRRSIRKFKNTPIDNQVVSLLSEALLSSPSSRGINPWEFVIVTDAALIEKLSHAKANGSAFLCGAPLAIIVCGDEAKSDVWVEDCSIASIIVQLTAHSIGLGSCWIQIRNRTHRNGQTSESFVQSTLGIPDTMRVESIIAVGFPDEQPEAVNGLNLEVNKIHNNMY